MNKNVFRGITWMITATILFVLVTAIVRYIGNEIPASQAAFIRYVIGTIILLPFIIPLIKNLIKKRDLIIYVIRGGLLITPVLIHPGNVNKKEAKQARRKQTKKRE